MELPNLPSGRSGLEALGNLVDKTLNIGIKRMHKAPILEGIPRANVWYRIVLDEGMSGDGSGYHIYVKKGRSNHLCLFLSGGGVAWDEYTAAHPTTVGAVAAGMPNYYWNNLRPLTQIMNIHTGITEVGNPENPFDDWNFVIVTYATGDLHVGNSQFHYVDENGEEKILYFHGYQNFLAAVNKGRELFPDPDKLLIAGDSAGGFAVPALTPIIINKIYSECADVTLFSDSAQMIFPKWRHTAKEVWKAPAEIWQAIRSYNITVDWYKALYKRIGNGVRYLYAGSPRDYLLSAYYNDVFTGHFQAPPAVQDRYYRHMQKMLKQLKEITPEFGFFIYSRGAIRMPLGGTEHTSVRHKSFYEKTPCGLSLAEWLNDSVNGKITDANMDMMRRH